MNNIAEGHESGTDAKFFYFLNIARGSCGEVRSMLYLCEDLGFCTATDRESLQIQVRKITSGIVKLANTLSKKTPQTNNPLYTQSLHSFAHFDFQPLILSASQTFSLLDIQSLRLSSFHPLRPLDYKNKIMTDYSKTIDFIKSVYGNQDFTPLAVPVFAGNEKKYLNECIDTTFVSSVGKFVDRFEEDMAKYTGAKKAVVCVSGTNALHMSLLLVGVKQDDEVLTQALTFIATCNALSYIGAHAVFIDVDRSTMGLSPNSLKAWLEKNAEVRKNARKGELPKSRDFAFEEDDLACYNKSTGRRVKACVPMHSFGHPVRIDEIAAICKEWHIELVEDAAESIGSTFKGQHTGTFGKIGAISFNGNKTITTGGGGMMLFNDEELGAYAKHITTQAKIPHRWEFRHDHIGFNYRMPNINAAMGCAQLENIDKYVASKRKVAAEYEEYFKNVPDIEFFVDSANTVSNYWLNAVILKDKEAQIDFLTQTNDNGVMTRPIWELMNRLPMFENCENDGLENTIWFADRVVNIPSSVRPSDLPKV